MDEEKAIEDNLTSEEAEEAEETGMTGEEAHRYEEFDELRGLVTRVLDAIDKLRSEMKELVQQNAAVSVESGAVVTDESETAVIDDDDYRNPLDELDFRID